MLPTNDTAYTNNTHYIVLFLQRVNLFTPSSIAFTIFYSGRDNFIRQSEVSGSENVKVQTRCFII